VHSSVIYKYSIFPQVKNKPYDGASNCGFLDWARSRTPLVPNSPKRGEGDWVTRLQVSFRQIKQSLQTSKKKPMGCCKPLPSPRVAYWILAFLSLPSRKFLRDTLYHFSEAVLTHRSDLCKMSTDNNIQ
jgi:hypothetical protein